MDTDHVQNNGMTAENPPLGVDATVVIVFFAVALFNVLELVFIIATTFKRRRGLYFWSFVVSTGSIVPYSVGFLVKFFTDRRDLGVVWASVIFVGWCGMVTGQSLVLWSRLHLVMYDRRRQRVVLAVIVADAVICHGGVSALLFGVNSHHPEPFVQPYAIFERIQLTVFSVQETVISALYIYETAMLLRRERSECQRPASSSSPSSNSPSSNSPNVNCHTSVGGRRCSIGHTAWQHVLRHLVYISGLIILLDAPLLALQYADLYGLQTAYKAFVYSVKLKLEFSILNRLIEVTTEYSTAAAAAFEAELGVHGAAPDPDSDPDAASSSSQRTLHKPGSFPSPAVTTTTTTTSKSPRRAYEETLAQLRSDTPPLPSSMAALQRKRSEKRPGCRSSDILTFNVALGNGASRIVKFQEKGREEGEQEGKEEGQEEEQGIALTPLEAMAFRFDDGDDDDDDDDDRKGDDDDDHYDDHYDDHDAPPPSRLPRRGSSLNGHSLQRESERQTGPWHRRGQRSDEGAYLTRLQGDGIDLDLFVSEKSMP